MLVIGKLDSTGKIRVDGCFSDGSTASNIAVTNPPNPPESKIGHDTVLFLNSETRELFWDYIERPLTNEETVAILKQENAELKTKNAEMTADVEATAAAVDFIMMNFMPML